MFIPTTIPYRIAAAAAALALPLGAAPAAHAAETLPILVPLTKFIALEGTSQKRGSLLAFRGFEELKVEPNVLDTASSPQVATQAFARATRGDGVFAVIGPIYGNSMLAMMPLAARRKLPILTVSGTGKLTEQGNKWVFRFFPSDAVLKVAQARYVVEELDRRKIALITQSTAYGQSGRAHLKAAFGRMGAKIVYENSLTVGTKEMLPVLANIRRSGADVVVLQLHSGPSALFVRQAAAFGLKLPVVGGSALHQPTTAALVEPATLKNVCAETASSPISEEAPPMKAFTAAFRKEFDADPDAFALADYDAVRMVLSLRKKGIKTGTAMRDALATTRYQGLAMSYRSDGKGNMAHDAVIVCYDGESRVPAIVKRYRINLADNAPR